MPFRIAFSADATGGAWLFEVCVSLCFCVDLALSFFTAIWLDGIWVTDRRIISDACKQRLKALNYQLD